MSTATPSETAQFTDLIARLSPGALTTDPDVIDAHSSDEALFCPREGAIALVRAASVEDVQEVMRFATAHRIPVVPQGPGPGSQEERTPHQARSCSTCRR